MNHPDLVQFVGNIAGKGKQNSKSNPLRADIATTMPCKNRPRGPGHRTSGRGELNGTDKEPEKATTSVQHRPSEVPSVQPSADATPETDLQHRLLLTSLGPLPIVIRIGGIRATRGGGGCSRKTPSPGVTVVNRTRACESNGNRARSSLSHPTDMSVLRGTEPA
jgi:hypothetical protein